MLRGAAMFFKTSLLALALLAPVTTLSACSKCRPLVQAGIHNADFAPHLSLMILPVALIVSVAMAVYLTPFRRAL